MNGKYTTYKNFGKVYEMTSGEMIIRVTVDIGPRIIYFGNKDYNLMYEDVDRLSARGGEFFDKNFGQGKKWYNLGGHRLWKSPEDLASYSIDDTAVDVTLTDNGAIFRREAEKTTGLIKEIEVEVLDNSRIKVEHRFINTLDKATEVAIWALTVLRANGRIIVPLNDNNKGFLPARNIVYWSYDNYNDERFNVNGDMAVLKQSNKFTTPFKFGIYSEKGVSGYLVDGILFSKTFDVKFGGKYPDYVCNFESYTNERIIECETLGELTILKKDEVSTHTEIWQYEQVGQIDEKEASRILLSK